VLGGYIFASLFFWWNLGVGTVLTGGTSHIHTITTGKQQLLVI
jgi:hypothetical protein